MRNFFRLAGCVLLVSLEVHLTYGKEWRGITPLHSTRKDVIRILGLPEHPQDLYNLPNEIVLITYSSGTCDQNGVWNVPRDTVQKITVSPKKSVSIDEMQINLDEYEVIADKHLPGVIYYNNSQQGIHIQTNQERVTSIDYLPAASDSHLRCPTSNEGPPLTKSGETIDSHRLFDSYGRIPFASEKRRLNLLGLRLQQMADAHAYIVAYPGRRMSFSEAMSRAQRAKAYLMRKYKLQDQSIEIIKGTRFKEFTIRLYLAR